MNQQENKMLINPTVHLDYLSEEVKKFLVDLNLTELSDKEKVILIYNKVRDHFLYDPYRLDLRSNELVASKILKKKRAWCVEKSIVMAACLRSINIPCKLGYANVINHIGTEKLVDILKSQTIACHGYVNIYIDDKWVKATPSFDKRICKLLKVSPLEFNGEEDSLFQEFRENEQFMEYEKYLGEYSDVPVEMINKEMKKNYPHLFKENIITKEFYFVFE
jgi:transglutaminase-like putative cysteine protease